jgi:acyl-CoA synthetase (NDP forming)/RimJ/RimL family protein N-acetyltransferase
MSGSTSAPAYPESWVTDVVLRDGRTVHVRPITAADAVALDEFHERQSPESIYFRFLSPRPRLSRKDLRYFTEIDYRDRMAFVAEVGDELIAVARYERYSGTDTAEVAFFVDDRHHGRGLATLMLEYLAAAARHRGIRRFSASTLPNNRKMLNVFARAGYDVHSQLEDGVIALSFAIDPTERSTAAAEGRERSAEAATVKRLLRPASIAVIGSASPDGLGVAVLESILAGGFPGRLTMVTESGSPPTVAVPTSAEVPENTDLAVVAVQAERVPAVVTTCARAGVGAILIMSSGFGEAALDGRALEAEIVEIARRHGVRILGPDCLGILNTDSSVRLHATIAPSQPPRGPIAMLAESGTLAAAILEKAEREEMGVSTFVAGGGSLDVGATDMLSFWTEDDRTSAVLLYLRSSVLGSRLLRATRAASLTKPVAVLGHLLVGAGGDVPLTRRRVAALTRQTGIISVGTLEQLVDIGRILADQPVPRGRGIAVIGNSEGAVALAADACVGSGLVLAPVLHSDENGTTGPSPGSGGWVEQVTLSFRASAEHYASALEQACADPSVDSVLVVHSPPRLIRSEDVSEVLAAASAANPEVCFAAVMLGADEPPRISDRNGSHHVPVFSFPEHPAKAMGRLASYREWVTANRDVQVDTSSSGDIDRAGEVVRSALGGIDPSDSVMLDLQSQEKLLAAFNVSMAERVVVTDADQALEVVERIGWPVALKADRRDRRTRSAVSGVAIDLADEADLRQTWTRMANAIGPDMHPMVVQRFIERGVDAAVTIRRTPSATTIEVGLGGPATALDGPELGYLPLTLADARSLVASSAVGRALTDPLDRVGLIGVVQRLADLVEHTEEVMTLIADPVVASVRGAWVADVSIEVRAPVDSLGVRQLG